MHLPRFCWAITAQARILKRQCAPPWKKQPYAKGPGCAPFQLCLWLVAVRPVLHRPCLKLTCRTTPEQPRNGKRENCEKTPPRKMSTAYVISTSVHKASTYKQTLVLGRSFLRRNEGAGSTMPWHQSEWAFEVVPSPLHLSLPTSGYPGSWGLVQGNLRTHSPLCTLSGSDPGPQASDIYSTVPSCCCISGTRHELGFNPFSRSCKHFQDGPWWCLMNGNVLSQTERKNLHQSPNLLVGKYSKINTF